MSPTRCLVHEGRADRSGVVTILHLLVDHLKRVNRVLRESLHVYSSTLGFSDFKTTSWLTGFIAEKILNFFIINFKHRKLNLILPFLVCVGIDSLEDLVTRDRHDTLVLSISNLHQSVLE